MLTNFLLRNKDKGKGSMGYQGINWLIIQIIHIAEVGFESVNRVQC
jgi:hypothetical protein